MNHTDIFRQLIEAGQESNDPRGVVTAGLVRQGDLIAVQGSGDEGRRHAEDLLLERVEREDLILPDDELFVTLIPCIQRSIEGMTSCARLLVEAGVQRVVFAAGDPSQNEATIRYLRQHDVELVQAGRRQIREQARQLFNGTLDEKRSSHPLPNRV